MSWQKEMQLALALRAVCDADTPAARHRAVIAGRALADETLNPPRVGPHHGIEAPPADEDHARGAPASRRGCVMPLLLIAAPLVIIVLAYIALGHP